MSWGEFTTLLGGILPETPLGQIVGIRSENNKDVLKNFTKEQHRIRSKWRSRAIVKLDEKEAKQQIKSFQEAMKKVFSKIRK